MGKILNKTDKLNELEELVHRDKMLLGYVGEILVDIHRLNTKGDCSQNGLLGKLSKYADFLEKRKEGNKESLTLYGAFYSGACWKSWEEIKRRLLLDDSGESRDMPDCPIIETVIELKREIGLLKENHPKGKE